MPGGPEPAAWALPDPLVARTRLGIRLRAVREAGGLTRARACARLEWSESKLIRVESGTVGLRRTDLDAMLDLYGAAGPEAAGLASLAAAGRSRAAAAWHSRYGTILSPGTGAYLSCESSAAGLFEHCSFAVPPLLQTDDYARAMLRALRAPRIEDQLALLAERRRRLTAAAAGAIAYTLDEGVLHRRVGGPAVMSRQVASLHEIAGSLGAEVAVIPYGAGAYPLPPDAFTVVELASGDSVAYHGCYERHAAPDAGAAAAYRARFAAMRRTCLTPRPAAQMSREAAAARTAAQSPEAGR